MSSVPSAAVVNSHVHVNTCVSLEIACIQAKFALSCLKNTGYTIITVGN